MERGFFMRPFFYIFIYQQSEVMAKHIGIVACSAEGAALCYQTICKEGADLMGKHNHPEISMHTYPLNSYMEYIYQDDWKGVAELMLRSALNLKAAGADFLICPDNTIHQNFKEVEKRSRKGIISIRVFRHASYE